MSTPSKPTISQTTKMRMKIEALESIEVAVAEEVEEEEVPLEAEEAETSTTTMEQKEVEEVEEVETTTTTMEQEEVEAEEIKITSMGQEVAEEVEAEEEATEEEETLKMKKTEVFGKTTKERLYKLRNPQRGNSSKISSIKRENFLKSEPL